MRSFIGVWCALACGPNVAVDDASGSATDSSGSTTAETQPMTGPTTTPTTTTPATTSTTTATTTVTTGETESTGSTGDPTPCVAGDCAIDVLFVIDNSGSMAREQRRLAQTMGLLADTLVGLGLDAQVMFTTTDFGNPLCTPFEPEGYSPARGAPIGTACAARLDDFTGLGADPEIAPWACEDVCPVGIAPEDVAFVRFGGDESNVPEGSIADALACLLPMGINGCGYEAQLETMLQALNPDQMWNNGPLPFLRNESMLAIVILTDETDCSVMDYDIMMDEQYYEINPDTTEPAPSSAICWNAGMSCDGPDGSGLYSNCAPVDLDALQPVSRYTNYIVDELRENQGKEVVMLGVVGVPSVTAHADQLPGTPIAGGVFDLEYRTWRSDDILPEDVANGVNAADKEFDFGIGPGCTGVDGRGEYTQATPPGRIREFCEALNVSDELTDQRCCLESVCDGDYSGAMACLGGLIENVVD